MPSLLERVESVVAWVAPGWAEKRQRQRHARELQDKMHRRLVERYFSGADDAGRLRGDRWLKSRLSPDDALESDLQELREHTRELYRDFPYVTGAIDHRTDNVVGTGRRPQARIAAVEGIISEADAERWNSDLESLWERWATHAGRGARTTFASLQRLAHRCWKRDGDCLIVWSDVDRPGKPVPLQVDVIVAERIETPPGKESERIRLGVQRDSEGNVEGYWVRETHPDDSYDHGAKHTFYSVERAALLSEMLWPDQSRGLPWAFSVLSEARDFADFKEAVMIAGHVAACSSLLVSTGNPALLAAGSANLTGEHELAPGRIYFGDLTTQFSQLNPAQPSTTWAMFAEWQLLSMASGLNYPFGWFVKDRRRATFSAGRLEEIDGAVPLRNDHCIMRDVMYAPTWERFVVEAVVLGLVDIPLDLFRRMPWLFLRSSFPPPGRPWVDPMKEVNAAVLAKQHNIKTMADIIGHGGEDRDEVFATRARERRKEEALGIVPPDESARAQPPGAPDNAGDDTPDDGPPDDE